MSDQTGAGAGDGQRAWEHTGRRVEKERVIRAPAGRVWQALTDPADISRWFVDDARGEVAFGKTFTWVWEEMGMEVEMECVEVQGGRRFVLLARWPDGTPSHLEVTLERDGDDGGRTRVHLVQSGWADEAEDANDYAGTNAGWDMALTLLDHYLAHHAGREHHAALTVRAAPWTPNALADLFHDEGALASWLTTAGAIGEPGDPVELALRDGTTLTGRVLGVAGAEVSLSWDEVDGVLELKAFGAGDQRFVGVNAHSWSTDPKVLEERRPGLEGAVEALADALTDDA